MTTAECRTETNKLKDLNYIVCDATEYRTYSKDTTKEVKKLTCDDGDLYFYKTKNFYRIIICKDPIKFFSF